MCINLPWEDFWVLTTKNQFLQSADYNLYKYNYFTAGFNIILITSTALFIWIFEAASNMWQYEKKSY